MKNITITNLEKNLISAFLRNPDQFRALKRHVPESMFSVPLYAKTISGMHACAAHGADIDAVNIATLSKLTSSELVEVSELLVDNQAGGYAPELFRQLLSERVNGELLHGMRAIAEELKAGNSDAIETLDALHELHSATNSEILAHVDVSMADKLAEYDAYLQKGLSLDAIIPVPFPTLSRMTGKGWRPGDYILLGGRAGAGKTSFMLTLGMHAAKFGKRVAFLSGEMPINEIFDRMTGIHTGMDIDKIRDGMDRDATNKFLEWADAFPFEVFGCYENTRQELQREVDALLYKKYDMIIIDYLQKFAYSPDSTNEFTEIQRVSGILRNYALRSKCVFLVASSMNRNEASNQKMSLHSFYGSSKLGHDGTIGLILDAQEDDANEMQSGHRAVTLQVAKNRNGARGEINLNFFLKSQRMTEAGFNTMEAPALRHYQETNEEIF